MATQQQQQNKTQGKGSDIRTGMQGSQELEAQNRYWRENFRNEPYYAQGKDFDAYEPAYRLGVEAHGENRGKQFNEVEAQLRSQYEANRQGQQAGLDWTQAKPAVRAAWDRSEQALLGDGAQANRQQQQPRH